MFGFGQLIDILKENPKKIVFTEGTDPRILEASSRLLASNFLAPILIGKPEEVEAAAEKSGFNIITGSLFENAFAVGRRSTVSGDSAGEACTSKYGFSCQ